MKAKSIAALQRVAVQECVVSACCGGGGNTIDARVARSAYLPGSVLFWANLRGKVTGAIFRCRSRARRLLAVLLVVHTTQGGGEPQLSSLDLRLSCYDSE